MFSKRNIGCVPHNKHVAHSSLMYRCDALSFLCFPSVTLFPAIMTNVVHAWLSRIEWVFHNPRMFDAIHFRESPNAQSRLGYFVLPMCSTRTIIPVPHDKHLARSSLTQRCHSLRLLSFQSTIHFSSVVKNVSHARVSCVNVMLSTMIGLLFSCKIKMCKVVSNTISIVSCTQMCVTVVDVCHIWARRFHASLLVLGNLRLFGAYCFRAGPRCAVQFVSGFTISSCLQMCWHCMELFDARCVCSLPALLGEC